MDVKEAILTAKNYVADVYAEEHVTDLTLEEVDNVGSEGRWVVTIGFSRPWKAPRTRAQEVLETLGGGLASRRSYKVVTLADDGKLLSMKNPARLDAAE